jgi:hypothetical protein
MPPSPVRWIFAAITLVPGLLLFFVLTVFRKSFDGLYFGGLPLAIQIRYAIHMFLAVVWLLVALVVALSATSLAIHALGYGVIAFFHLGKCIRLSHYDQ